jgi:hypothetical protein
MTTRNRGEEELVRTALPALCRAYPEALVMRNEANACTALMRACCREVARVLSGHDLLAAQDAISRAYSTIPDGVKYGLGVGSADVIVCAGGRFVALEFKTPDGVQSPAQRTWEGWVDRAGGVYEVVRSVEEALEVVSG